MANSRKSPRASGGPDGDPIAVLENALRDALAAHVAPESRVAVALSGGIDSMVLLDVAAALAASEEIVVSAIHVDHGLSPNAGRWAEFCATQCAARGVGLTLHEPRIERPHGRSLEAEARAARYACLLSADVDVVLLAHHADDQAETVLLQLLRGAGPRGLAAMPPFRPGRPALLRPFLEHPRARLAAYAAARGLSWIDDESNANRALARNALRHDVAPLLAARFPGYPQTLVRGARLQAQASALLDDLAKIDASGAVDASGLDEARLAALSPVRARNLLRWFLCEQGARPPSEARVKEMLRQLLGAGAGGRLRIRIDGMELGRYRGRVVVHAPGPQPFELPWRGEAEVRLPGGLLVFTPARGVGLATAKLAQGPVVLRSRAGGERMRLAENRPTRTLKQLLQEARVPSWMRHSLPLVWCGDELAAVAGIGVALKFQAEPGEPGWTLEWRPSPVRGAEHRFAD
jgi:tRNA(Ile)-lysidine synthase